MICPHCHHKRKVSDKGPKNICSKCGASYSYDVSNKTKHRKGLLIFSHLREEEEINLLLAILGILLLCIGVFCPLMSFPISQTINALHMDKWFGYILLSLGVASLYAALVLKFRWLILTGAVSFVWSAVNFHDVYSKMSKPSAALSSYFQNTPLSGLAEMASSAVHLQWGWFLLFIGSILIFLAGIIKR